MTEELEEGELPALLSQETRNRIVQMVLGHPEHLMSMAEITEMVGVNPSTAKYQVRNLIDGEILEMYIHRPNRLEQRTPVQFYGFSELGVRILHEHNLLSSLPEMRARYMQIEKSETTLRHERAPRPELPAIVTRALEYYGDEVEKCRR